MQSITNPYGNHTNAGLKPNSNGSDNGGSSCNNFNNGSGGSENNENI